MEKCAIEHPLKKTSPTAVVVDASLGEQLMRTSRHFFSIASIFGILTLEMRISRKHFTSCSFRVTGIGCEPEDAVSCDEGFSCLPGPIGYTCGEDQLLHDRLRVPL